MYSLNDLTICLLEADMQLVTIFKWSGKNIIPIEML